MKDYDIIIGALLGSRGEDQQTLADVGLQWIETMLRKNADYGSSIFSTKSLAGDVDASARILVRMDDKINRLYTLAKKNNESEVDESFSDTVQDLGVYCLLYLVAQVMQREDECPLDECEVCDD